MVNLLGELEELILGHLTPCSYHYVARKFNINADVAKDLLSKVHESQKGKVEAYFCVSGVNKGDGNLTVSLVKEDQVKRHELELESHHGTHVYR